MVERPHVAERSPFFADHGDELPVGTQLGWRLRALIVSGRLGAGDRLPTVRALAEWAGVNVNTVRAVYELLEAGGLVVSRHGRGTFVADDARGSEEVERIATEAIAEARAAGIDPRDLAVVAMVCATVPEALEEAPHRPAGPAEIELPEVDLEGDERVARRELRRQIEWLEAALATEARELPREAPPGPVPRWREESHVAGVEELERVRDALAEQLAEARGAAERRAVREGKARERREAMLRDPGAHRWEVVSAEDVGEPGCAEWEVSPRFGPLGALMRWWQVKVSGGCPLAAPREAASGRRGDG